MDADSLRSFKMYMYYGTISEFGKGNFRDFIWFAFFPAQARLLYNQPHCELAVAFAH
jgi:hypothetical protein